MSVINNKYWHRTLERRTTLFAVLATVAVVIGGAVEIIPMYYVDAVAPNGPGSVEHYTPLELAGRDIYIREGCYNCHSQMIRPTYSETLRYGEWTRSYEVMWDRPFQLGSRRIGPDLAREGGLRSDAWHYDHFRDPRALQVGSIMPSYEWLLRWKLDPADVQASVQAMQTLGVPYTDQDVATVEASLQAQGQQIVDNLSGTGIEAAWDDEVIAVIAYLQHLGTTLQLPAGDAGDAGTEPASN
jgi:cytochrome c oxidase cbb3-type subunit I/II